MKWKIISCILTLCLFTVTCKLLSNHYAYVDHYVYVYKFVNDSTIKFVDRHNIKYLYQVDSITYNYIHDNKKARFLLRKYDTDKLILLNKNYY